MYDAETTFIYSSVKQLFVCYFAASNHSGVCGDSESQVSSNIF